MTKEIEKISAWYDGEISQSEFDKGLKELALDSENKKILHRYALLSELMQRQPQSKPSIVSRFADYLPKQNLWLSNSLTAAATVLITIVFLYQLDGDRFGSDKATQMQLTSALSSQEAKDQLLNADQNIMNHMIHIMQSNQSLKPTSISKDWIPVGFSASKQNPGRYTNGKNYLSFHIENNQLGINKVKYFQANKNWVYLIPLRDGRLLTAYGDVPPELANKRFNELTNRKR